MEHDNIASVVIDAAIRIHRELGPGLLESVYESILARALTKSGLSVDRQVRIPVKYDGEVYDEGFRADLIINGKVILELKSVEGITNTHKKQLLTYLKLSGLKLGFILNFNEELMKHGITRIINGKLPAGDKQLRTST